MFTPRVMTIKISQMARFMYFHFVDYSKNQSQFGQDI